MASGFVHNFDDAYPENLDQQEWGKFEGRPLLGELVKKAITVISGIEQFRQLPERNQAVLVSMAGFMIAKFNRFEIHDWRKNYWGLYVVGSQARSDARPDSDLDLLSVGTFYRDLGFIDRYGRLGEDEEVFHGFELEIPDELPSQYNIGAINRKYLVRATPRDESVLPVDISVVDLTFTEGTLDGFKNNLDVDEGGEPLPRVPLVELTVPMEDFHPRA